MPSSIRSVYSQPRIAAQVLNRMDQVANVPFGHQLVGQFGRQHDDGRPSLAPRPSPAWPAGGSANLATSSVTGPLGQSRATTVPSASNSASSLRGVGLGQRLFQLGQLLAQSRAKALQIGQHRVADVLIGLLR